MTTLNETMLKKYQGNFLQEVSDNVEEGEWTKMCMQCGVCSGSCPLGEHWEHPPQEIFMMIRANQREAVLSSESMWLCTSCYNCVARCPRQLPITHIMHGLAHYARRLGLAPKKQATQQFADSFWRNLSKTGRVNELKLSLSLYFQDGFLTGIKKSLSMAGVGLGMLKAKRLSPMEIIKGHSVKDVKGFHAMLKKATQLEAARIENNGAIKND